MAPIRKTSEMVWVVVVVKGGFPALVEVHREKKTARRRERLFLKDARKDYDEVGVFEVEIGSEVSI